MKKNIYLILAEENIFHPYYLLGIIKGLQNDKYKIVGVTVARDRNRKGFFSPYQLQFNIWGTKGFIYVGFLSAIRSILGQIDYSGNYSLKHICKRYDIPIVESYNVNDEKHLQFLRRKKIDILISSNGHIFKEELLKLPRIACINRHTALLPKYGGVLPVFWAMLNKEKKFGATIHYMVKKIDEGDIIYQEETELNGKNSLFKNYVTGFAISIKATLKALDNLEQKKAAKRNSNTNKTYYSLPNLKDFRRFRRRYKTIEMYDIPYYILNLVKE